MDRKEESRQMDRKILNDNSRRRGLIRELNRSDVAMKRETARLELEHKQRQKSIEKEQKKMQNRLVSLKSVKKIRTARMLEDIAIDAATIANIFESVDVNQNLCSKGSFGSVGEIRPDKTDGAVDHDPATGCDSYRNDARIYSIHQDTLLESFLRAPPSQLLDNHVSASSLPDRTSSLSLVSLSASTSRRNSLNSPLSLMAPQTAPFVKPVPYGSKAVGSKVRRKRGLSVPNILDSGQFKLLRKLSIDLGDKDLQTRRCKTSSVSVLQNEHQSNSPRFDSCGQEDFYEFNRDKLLNKRYSPDSKGFISSSPRRRNSIATTTLTMANLSRHALDSAIQRNRMQFSIPASAKKSISNSFHGSAVDLQDRFSQCRSRTGYQLESRPSQGQVDELAAMFGGCCPGRLSQMMHESTNPKHSDEEFNERKKMPSYLNSTTSSDLKARALALPTQPVSAREATTSAT